eukprot:jgi/Mesvir1/923/Mv17482-RA.1
MQAMVRALLSTNPLMSFPACPNLLTQGFNEACALSMASALSNMQMPRLPECESLPPIQPLPCDAEMIYALSPVSNLLALPSCQDAISTGDDGILALTNQQPCLESMLRAHRTLTSLINSAVCGAFRARLNGTTFIPPRANYTCAEALGSVRAEYQASLGNITACVNMMELQAGTATMQDSCANMTAGMIAHARSVLESPPCQAVAEPFAVSAECRDSIEGTLAAVRGNVSAMAGYPDCRRFAGLDHMGRCPVFNETASYACTCLSAAVTEAGKVASALRTTVDICTLNISRGYLDEFNFGPSIPACRNDTAFQDAIRRCGLSSSYRLYTADLAAASIDTDSGGVCCAPNPNNGGVPLVPGLASVTLASLLLSALYVLFM